MTTTQTTNPTDHAKKEQTMTIHEMLDKVRPALTRPGVEITLTAEHEADPRLFDGLDIGEGPMDFKEDDRSGLSWTIRVEREPVLWVQTGFNYQITSIRPANARAEVTLETARQFRELLSADGVPEEVA